LETKTGIMINCLASFRVRKGYSFETNKGRADETCETEGFVTVPRDQVPAGSAAGS
jgi:hypothetical protein